MSVAATTAVWEHSESSGVARLVLLAIADHADPVGVAWPSVARLAAMCRVSDRAVQNNVKHLEMLGELKREISKGRRGCNLYQINLPMNGNSKKNGVQIPPNHASPPKDIRGEGNDASPPNHGSPTPEDFGTLPPNHGSPEPSRTIKNREGEPARDARPPSPSDFEFCLEALAELFPNAVVPMPPDEAALAKRWVPVVVDLNPDDFEALTCWFVHADDQARGRNKWPRSRKEFLQNLPEAVEKVREWWSTSGASWWEMKQDRERKRAEKRARMAQEAREEDDGPLTPEEALAILRGEGEANE